MLLYRTSGCNDCLEEMSSESSPSRLDPTFTIALLGELVPNVTLQSGLIYYVT